MTRGEEKEEVGPTAVDGSHEHSCMDTDVQTEILTTITNALTQPHSHEWVAHLRTWGRHPSVQQGKERGR